jgi:hypothetical protein
MPLPVHQAFNYPGPTEGVTLEGSDKNLKVYNDVTSAIPSDRQVAILSIISNYKDGAVSGQSSITLADEDENIIFCVSAGGYSNNSFGFLYPPLLPAGKKLIIKCKGDDINEVNLVLYVQYMLVPV